MTPPTKNSGKAREAQAQLREALRMLNADPPGWLICSHAECSWPTGCTLQDRYEIDIPGRPFTANDWDGLHPARQRELKAEWRTLAQQVVTLSRPGPRMASPVRAVFQPYYPTAVPVDAGNLARWGKCVLDGIVHAGLLLDDGPTIVVEECYRARIVQPGPPHVIVTLALVEVALSPG